MKLSGSIHHLPKHLKIAIFFFIISLSFGYISGLLFVEQTTQFTSKGIVENYNGNQVEELETDTEILEDDFLEDDWDNDTENVNESAIEGNEIKFKKSKREMISIIHSHVISFSLIFFALAFLLATTSTPLWLKKTLMVEPFISILLTFGGIWLMWSGIEWFKYIVQLSGIALTLSYITSVLLILYSLIQPAKEEVITQ